MSMLVGKTVGGDAILEIMGEVAAAADLREMAGRGVVMRLVGTGKGDAVGCSLVSGFGVGG